MDLMKSHYQSEKLDKSNELNSTMTINETTQSDEYTRKLENLGGNA
jgi:hypothetical protein|nr:MAG TPA: hypothetical protein [Caudoviricetes sp.]